MSARLACRQCHARAPCCLEPNLHVLARGLQNVRNRHTLLAMNTEQLQSAIRQAGGPSEVARRVSLFTGESVRHYRVVKWAKSRIPAQYVLAMESAIGVPRATLRPDVFAASLTDQAA